MRTLADLKLLSGNLLLKRVSETEDCYEIVALGEGSFVTWMVPGAHLIASNVARVELGLSGTAPQAYYVCDKADVQARDLYVASVVPPDPTPDPDPDPTPITSNVLYVFPHTDTIYKDITALAVHPANTQWKQRINALAFHAEFGFDSDTPEAVTYGIPYNVVGQGQPLVKIVVDNSEGWEVLHSDFYPADQGMLPVPLNARRENDPVVNENIYDHDRHLITLVVDAQGKPVRLIELWHAVKLMENNKHVGWRCQNCSIFDCSKTLPQRPIKKTSADAAGLPLLPFLFTAEDIERARNKSNPADRHLGHALRFTLSSGAIRQAFTFPATHYTPSNTISADAMPFGARLRLRSDVSLYDILPAWGKSDVNDGHLDLSKAEVIALTLKKFGMIIADNGGPLYVTGCPFKASEYDANNEILRGLEGLKGSHFDFVNTGAIYDKNNLQAAATASGQIVWDE